MLTQGQHNRILVISDYTILARPVVVKIGPLAAAEKMHHLSEIKPCTHN